MTASESAIELLSPLRAIALQAALTSAQNALIALQTALRRASQLTFKSPHTRFGLSTCEGQDLISSTFVTPCRSE